MDIPAHDPPLLYLLFTLPPRDLSDDDLLTAFLEYVKHLGLELYPAQEEAVLELLAGKNVILNTPTGSGKSLVATAMHFQALALKQRSIYTAPIKALVNEKFFALCRDFGADNVGMLTGDAAVNREAPILCCTAEILANMALAEGAELDVGAVVIDEFHYYSDRDRGTAWQVPLLTLPQATFLLMSATFGDATFFGDELTKLTGRETAIVTGGERPVPLDFEYAESPLQDTVLRLVEQKRVPVYLVNFTQRSCAEEAQNLMSYDYCTKEEKRAIADALRGVRFDTPYGKEIQRFIRHGIGLHHAGLLPKYRLLVEKLAQRGHLKIISGTDTLGVGVNIPIRTVLFTKLCKFDGQKTALLRARDFHQIAGRAGRKGFDDRGSVVAQAPEHVIENLRLEAKAGNDPVKKKRIVRKRPPEKGYVHWDQQTFERLVAAPPEPLTSKFQVSHGMLINVLQRGRGGCKAMARILARCHEPRRQQRQLGRTASMMFKSLLDAGIVQLEPDRGVVIHADLQDDFSLNRSLSLFLVEVIDALDRESPTYALDLLTLVESILENPEHILMRQVDRLKTEKMAELKAAGVEYDQRIEELEKIEYPKPNAEFIYAAFNAFAMHHPWVGGEAIRPKAVAREMFENLNTVNDYVRDYGLERSEGLLLRYLSDCYKTLVQTVPAAARTEQVDDIITFLGAIVRSTDSSLIDEWEAMLRGEGRPVDTAPESAESLATRADRVDVTTDEKAFTVLIRNAMYSLLRSLERGDYDAAAELFEGSSQPPRPMQLRAMVAPYFEEHGNIRLDPPARSPQYTRFVSKDDDWWRIQQIICDPQEANDWMVACKVDLAASRSAGRPVFELETIST